MKTRFSLITVLLFAPLASLLPPLATSSRPTGPTAAAVDCGRADCGRRLLRSPLTPLAMRPPLGAELELLDASSAGCWRNVRRLVFEWSFTKQARRRVTRGVRTVPPPREPPLRLAVPRSTCIPCFVVG